MVALLKAIVDVLLNPLNVVMLLLLLSALFFWRKHLRPARWLMVLAVSYFVMTASDPLPQAMISSLENNYKPLDLSVEQVIDSPLYIMVLGSGHTADPDLPATGQLAPPALARLTEGVRLAHALPGSDLVFSGMDYESVLSQAEVMATAARSLGIDPDRIRKLPQPTTTAEEADAFLDTFGPQAALILVTSASHLPRAIRIFRNRGLQPLPAPADFHIKDDPTEGPDLEWFSHANLQYTELALHEYIGMLWERWKR